MGEVAPWDLRRKRGSLKRADLLMNLPLSHKHRMDRPEYTLGVWSGNQKRGVDVALQSNGGDNINGGESLLGCSCQFVGLCQAAKPEL